MIDFLSTLLKPLSADGIAWGVVLALVIFWAVGWLRLISRQAIPSLMTSSGILGTFLGIFIALVGLDFGPEQINDSIQSLLMGMETAFVTSLLGLASAIVFKVCVPVQRRSQSQDLAEHLNAIKQAIAGEGDSSLVTQMQKLRDENRDGFTKLDGLSETIRDALVKNLENLTQEIRDIIGKQLGESLQTLIKNIEEALINQFGKTFVEFNEATQALKKWQEDHRQQVEQLTTAFETTAQGIEKIQEDCARIPHTMESLRPILDSANSQIAELTARLEAFAEMRRQAEEAFPAIKENLDTIGQDLQSSAESFADLEQVIEKSFRAAEQIAESHAANVNELASGMRTTMEDAQKEVAGRVEGIIQAALEEHVKRTNAELDRVAKTWGENMASIADRCKEAIAAVDQLQNDQGDG